jgi:D-glycero-D-manno-heptose 1,7-bisphosphate phosphatase
MRLRPAVFLDKDGTLVVDVPFNVDPSKVVLAPFAAEGLVRLRRVGYALVLVSNQPGVGLGRFPAAALAAVDDRLCELLAPHGVTLDATYYCPHVPAPGDGHGVASCSCRKPAPGLLLRAAREHGLHLRRSWMIGDILHDVEAGRAAGCRTILLHNGGETEWRLGPGRTPHFTVPDLLQAAQIIARSGTPVAESVSGGRP